MTASREQFTPGSSMIENVAAQIDSSVASLPIEGVQAAADSIKQAQNALAETADSTANPALLEASQATNAAAEKAGAAITQLVTSGNALITYTNHILGANREGIDTHAANTPTLNTSVASSEAAKTAAPETQYIKAAVVVEERRVGDMQYTFALSSHTVQNAPEIARAVKECNVLLIESVGWDNDEQRAQYMRDLSAVTSRTIDPALIDEYVRGNPGSFGIAIANQLRGTDTIIVPIDINKDNPDYEKVIEFNKRDADKDVAGYMVAPLSRMRESVEAYDKASSESIAARDRLLAHQILTVHHDVMRTRPDARIGVVMGAAHYDVMKIAGFDNVTTADKTQARVAAMAGPDMQAHIQRAMGKDAAPQLLDRVALETYMRTTLGPNNLTTELVEQLPDDQVAAVLNEVDRISHKYPDNNFEQRRTEAAALFQRTLDAYKPKPRPVSMYIDTV